jgi:hypothetical protein
MAKTKQELKDQIAENKLSADLLNNMVDSIFVDGIESGTYTPTSTSVSNLTSGAVVEYETMYTRINDIVSVDGLIEITPLNGDGISTITSLTLSLPLSSEFTEIEDSVGIMNAYASDGEFGAIADVTTNEVLFSGRVFGTDPTKCSFHFTYKIK